MHWPMIGYPNLYKISEESLKRIINYDYKSRQTKARLFGMLSNIFNRRLLNVE